MCIRDRCITRQIITAIKTATRQKHIPLNTYVSLSKPVYEDESVRRLEDIIIGIKIMDPEELFISKENYTDMKIHLESLLSSLEQQVLSLYLEGQSYQEMSQSLQRPAKSIDNALQRIKHKIEVYLKNRDNECP